MSEGLRLRGPQWVRLLRLLEMNVSYRSCRATFRSWLALSPHAFAGLPAGRLSRVFSPNSGSEGVDTAIKFSRARTRRNAILYAEGGFHGLTCGPLSLMSNPFWKEGFGTFLPETTAVSFGDLAVLEKELASRRYAMFITEPIQAEAGIRIPSPDYLGGAQELCRRYPVAAS